MISEEKQLLLARVIVDKIWGDDLVDYTDDDQALRVAKQAVQIFIKEEDNLDQLVREKLVSLKRNVQDGSPEWDVLYRKYYEEELRRRG